MTELDETAAEGAEALSPSSGKLRSVGCLLLGIALFIVVMAITLPFLPTLVAIAMPPAPPLPQTSLTTVSHQNYDYGVDEWEYLASATPCDLVTYYQSVGGSCSITPFECGTSTDFSRQNELVARCAGREQIGQFGLVWEARINRIADDPARARLRIYRAINWLSSEPPPNN